MKFSARELDRIATRLRIDIIRMIAAAKSGHPGGSLSAIDILTTLFLNHMNLEPETEDAPDRHRFILSKGHGVPALYAVFAELRLIPHEELLSLRTLGSRLQGHPHRLAYRHLEASTGSLGQGLSIAQGMAMASKLDGSPRRIFCLVGDGEIQEGQIWESLLSAPKFGLDNLTVFLDYNKGQIDGPTNEVMNLEPLSEKLRAFRWDVQEIDGHDQIQIEAAILQSAALQGRPHFIIAHTTKGKGVSFMEGVIDWHGKAPSAEEADRAVRELEQHLVEGGR